MFEMYPVGLTSLADFLERNHYNVEIVNLAYRMLQDSRFDVEAHIRSMRAPVFGVDLHWLPHVQGALSIVDLVKRLHPEAARWSAAYPPTTTGRADQQPFGRFHPAR